METSNSLSMVPDGGSPGGDARVFLSKPGVRRRAADVRRRRHVALATIVALLLAAAVGLQKRWSTEQGLRPQHDPLDIQTAITELWGGSSAQTQKSASSWAWQWARPCALPGFGCNCTGTFVFSDIHGEAVREVHSNGHIRCTAEALGGASSTLLKLCWCIDGERWTDEVRQGLWSVVRHGYIPRIEVASDDMSAEDACSPEYDSLWYGCVTMNRRWDSSLVPQVMLRASPTEEQLDIALRNLDFCHKLAPSSSLRVLGVRSGEAGGVLQSPGSSGRVCSLVFRADEGPTWSGQVDQVHCPIEPGRCTTTPCMCRRADDVKLTLRNSQGQVCWSCAKEGEEHKFRVTAQSAPSAGGGSTWWPPYGIHCPPILWVFMDWRAVVDACPVLTMGMLGFAICLVVRKTEEFLGPRFAWWTQLAPLFGAPLKKGEVWRFFTFSFYHVQIMDLFQNVLTLLDTLDVEGTPAILLGDGSNLKCGHGAKLNMMCYPTIGIGSEHTLGVAIISAVVGGMCSTWINFNGLVSGSSVLAFGLSGTIVALYALYAGADLDQSLSSQRSFQDWVWLRLIFVGFHVLMEFVRSFSARDAAGLFTHTAAFIAGFSYVLCFLPPMGDGSMLPAEQPYVVPCAYSSRSGEFATGEVGECIRLFSEVYEYPVATAQRLTSRMFVMVVLITALNVYLARPEGEALNVQGLEVRALCGPRQPGAASRGPAPQNRPPEGAPVLLMIEIVRLLRLPLSGPEDRRQYQLKVSASTEEDDQGLQTSSQQLQVESRAFSASDTASIDDVLFLPLVYQSSNHLHFSLYEVATSDSTPSPENRGKEPLFKGSVPFADFRQTWNPVKLRPCTQESGSRCWSRIRSIIGSRDVIMVAGLGRTYFQASTPDLARRRDDFQRALQTARSTSRQKDNEVARFQAVLADGDGNGREEPDMPREGQA